VPLPVKARAVDGVWIRHAPGHSDLLGRSATPIDGRWQRADVTSALYLADSPETATAEWYRSLAERGFYPEDHLPFDHHGWRVDLELADLSSSGRLGQFGLSRPTPDRRSWPAFQTVGEQLFTDGWAGLLAPSAARPGSLIVCIFTAAAWPPPGCTPIDTILNDRVPPPPQGMTT
jgi:RES domain-containing protein